MPMEPALKALLVQTLLIAPYTGQSPYGAPTFGVDVPTPARIERHFQTMLTTTGAQLVEETKAFVDGDAVVNERSRVTFEDGSIVPLEGIKPVLAIDGTIHHFELFF